MEGEKKLLLLVGSKDTSKGAYLESIDCFRLELDLGRLWSFDWRLGAQVGLHDLPVEGQLHVTSAPEREKDRVTEFIHLKKKYSGACVQRRLSKRALFSFLPTYY